MKDKSKTKQQDSAGKDVLTQQDINDDIRTFADTDQPHAPLETPEGKNNGAEPAVFKGQQKYHT